MSIWGLEMFKFIKDEDCIQNLDEDELYAELNRYISSSIMRIIDMDNNILLST